MNAVGSHSLLLMTTHGGILEKQLPALTWNGQQQLDRNLLPKWSVQGLVGKRQS